MSAGRRSWLDALPYFYLARVQVMTLMALILVPPVAKWGAPALLKGIFDVDSQGMILVALTAALASWTVMLTTWQVLLYGPERFGIAPFPLTAKDLHNEPGVRGHWAAFILLALPSIGFAIWISIEGGTAKFVPLAGGAIVGFGVAWLVMLGAAELRSQKWAEWSWLRGLFVKLGDGYRASNNTVYPGHFTAFWSFGICAAFYVVIGLGKWVWLGDNTAGVPTLVDLLVYLMIVCWGFAGITFYFDRWRIPLLLLVFVWAIGSSHAPWTDHYFSTLPVADTPHAISPADVIDGTKPGADVILVAASGGGIKAAGWTTQVLTGLEQQHGKIFGDSIRLISAVSGGSVGAMYFVAGYDANGNGLSNSPDALKGIVDRSETSSLDDIAWGLVYPDFLRVFIPVLRDEDRGIALEQSFLKQSPNDLSKGLSTWRNGVKEGWRPAVVFNSTVVESGERMLMGTTDLTARGGNDERDGEGRTDLASDPHFDHRDVSIATAVRLSAAFPYVSPAARPINSYKGAQRQIHIVDGGYTDNFGMATLLTWLDEALENSRVIRRVLIIEIRASAQEDDPTIKRRGWTFQTYAPISTMLDVRDTGQLPRNTEQRLMLQHAASACHATVEDATFTYRAEDAPLSWHLSNADKAELKTWWDTSNQKGKQIVKDFLANKDQVGAARTHCDALEGLEK